MLLFVCVVLVLGLTSAQEDHCCTPDVWEGEIHAAAGAAIGNLPRTVHNFDRILYDYETKQRVYIHSSRFDDGSELEFRIIYHYNDRRRYFIQDGQCRVEDVTVEMTRFCVSSEAEFTRDVVFGAGSHTLSGKLYYQRIADEEGHDVGAEYFYVTSEGCIPVRRVRYEINNHGPVISSETISEETYLNIVPEIRDREDFVPPTDCAFKEFPKYIEDIPAYKAFLKTM